MLPSATVAPSGLIATADTSTPPRSGPLTGLAGGSKLAPSLATVTVGSKVIGGSVTGIACGPLL